MSRNGKVVVAMSGGVDSSVAAWLLKEQGYDCVGVFMRVGAHAPEHEDACATGIDGEPSRRLKHGCCSAGDASDARAIAGKLGIPFYALNFEPDFDRIIDYFVDEYSRARTPNPCVMCNIALKFGKLLRYADLVDAEFVATGHYARVLHRSGRTHLARSLNRAKDQSYVLFGIRREDLPRCLFPLGGMPDKGDVRRIAAELGLRVHDKPDSQEICFVPDDDYKRLVRQRRPETRRPGKICDSAGNVLGDHDGVAGFTIGQRRGLGIAVGRPVYVTRLDVLSNTVTVGPRAELYSDGLIADQVNWLVDPSALARFEISDLRSHAHDPRPGPSGAVRTEIKIRYMHTPTPGSIWLLETGDVEARFDTPLPAVTPGQAAVFYGEDDIVLGGGWIQEGIQNSE